MQKKTPINQPTRQSVQQLLNQLLRTHVPVPQEIRDIEEEMREAHKDLDRTPRMRQLGKRQKKLYKEFRKKRDKEDGQIRALNQKFLANGVTPELVAALNKIIVINSITK